MDKEIYKALRDKALGFETKEVTEEKDAEGKLLKTKTVKKKVLPDLTAIKMLLDMEGEKGNPISLEEMEKEKMRLIKELMEFEKKKNGQMSVFEPLIDF